jgi:DNA-binding MarR family transcriptional regulator
MKQTTAEIPTNIGSFLCFALYSTSRKMGQLYQKYLDPLNLTYPQLLVLILLKDGEAHTVSSIGEKLFLDSGTVTPLLKRMQLKKLIARKRSKEDERTVEIRISKEGVKMLGGVADLGVKLLCDLEMNPKEVSELASRIHKVRQTIETRL